MEIFSIVIMSLCALYYIYCIYDTIINIINGQKIYFPILIIISLSILVIIQILSIIYLIKNM